MSHFPLTILAWQAFTIKPFIISSQVPQSPFLQLYVILTLALLATALTFSPALALTGFPFIVGEGEPLLLFAPACSAFLPKRPIALPLLQLLQPLLLLPLPLMVLGGVPTSSPCCGRPSLRCWKQDGEKAFTSRTESNNKIIVDNFIVL